MHAADAIHRGANANDRHPGRRIPQLAPVLSKDPVTTRVPSGLNDALRTPASKPHVGFPIGAYHGLRIPNARGKVVGRGYHPRPVRTKRRTVDRILVQHGLVDRQPARRIPRPRCLIAGRGNNSLAVGAERRAIDLSLPVARCVPPRWRAGQACAALDRFSEWRDAIAWLWTPPWPSRRWQSPIAHGTMTASALAVTQIALWLRFT